ncbi:NlpC/P60 family protein [Nocardia cyriacigeorgica]|uniref:NlpC/P60 family protein n=1 Tax=Nocardia cyriacigeorgica TaxID=135487 RepID=UPI000CE9D11D|nr:NlpC/P60 family protein [Nocardia cyriacigeorgica]AVH23832.1 invasin [Nocardia cyriacigeorgica]MBF6324131.1 C40 family peptidase [Nocardia cyriacigeorgica]PPJ07027.1 invasin [Nocardia cyriacigeorgica]
MRNMRGPSRRRPLSIALGLLVAAAIVVTGAPSTAVPPPPPNPSDGELADAGARVDAGIGQVGLLINQVAAVDEQVRQLDDAVALRREQVNKALVDLQNARDAADAAADLVATTQRELSDAGTRVEQARTNFDEFATQAYTRPGTGTMMTYLSAADPDAALDRAQIIGLVTKNQQQVMDGLRRAQIDQGNKNASARQAKTAADAAAADAEQKKTAAEAAVSAATAELNQQTAVRDDLLRQRADAQARLDAARMNVTGLQNQRDAYQAWDQQRRAEEAAVLAAAAAAAARAAADQAARDRAAQLGAGKRPHTQLEDSPRTTKPTPRSDRDDDSESGSESESESDSSGSGDGDVPSVTGSEAIEIVVDRAMSQLGVTYAWGGGDEDGPTLGIRDGGVADSHGDYNKVGFDCSGLMIYAFAGIGVSLPHYSGYQYNAGTRVPVDERERGDMLFWGPNGSQHVALYLGDGKMIEAPQSGDVVKVSPVRESGIMPYAVRIVTS